MDTVVVVLWIAAAAADDGGCRHQAGAAVSACNTCRMTSVDLNTNLLVSTSDIGAISCPIY